MPDVEFLTPEGRGGPSPDRGHGRRPLRRPWLIALAAVVLAGGATAVALTNGGSSSPGATAHSPSGAHSANASVSTTPAAAPPLGHVPDGSAAIFVDGTILYYAHGSLTWLPVSRGGGGSVRLDAALAPLPAGTPAQLAADPAHHRAWLITLDAATTRVIGFAVRGAGGIAQRSSMRWPGQALGAAVLDGRLYVTTTTGVVRPGRHGLVAVRALRGGRAITADPSRHRLILTDHDLTRIDVRTYRPGGSARIRRVVTLPMVDGAIQTVGTRIWVGGLSSGGRSLGVLVRLDPVTLRPARHSPLDRRLVSEAVPVAAGRRALFVREGSVAGTRLWCLDGRTGAVLHTWLTAGRVVTGAGGAYVVSLDGATVTASPLVARACT